MTRAEQAACEYAGLQATPTNDTGILTTTDYYTFLEGYEQAEQDLLAIVKESMEKGERCMQQSGENGEPGEYAFWDGFHNCAENILRELEK